MINPTDEQNEMRAALIIIDLLQSGSINPDGGGYQKLFDHILELAEKHVPDLDEFAMGMLGDGLGFRANDAEILDYVKQQLTEKLDVSS